MLLAGASVAYTAFSGAFTFVVYALPSHAWWDAGSAFIYIMLLAGAGYGNPSAIGGALTFRVYSAPSAAWWDYGSAY